MNRAIFIFALGLVFLLLAARPAYAYLDPCTGSFILQILIGAFLGALFAIKLFWARIWGFVGGIFSKKVPAEEDTEHDE